VTKHAIITGGTQGIGLALVEKFLQEGFIVTTCSRTVAKLPVAVANHASIRVMAADLSTRPGIEAFATFALAATPADVLIHNTGTYLPGNVQTEAEGTLETLLATNVQSAYHLTRALLPAMLLAKKGHIFTLCSVASLMAYPNGGSYSISKFALLGFTKVLRAELIGTALRVTAILPGAVKTPSWDGVDLPEDRFIPPADIASAIWSCYQMAPSTVIEELLVRPLLGDI